MLTDWLISRLDLGDLIITDEAADCLADALWEGMLPSFVLLLVDGSGFSDESMLEIQSRAAACGVLNALSDASSGDVSWQDGVPAFNEALATALATAPEGGVAYLPEEASCWTNAIVAELEEIA